MTFSPGQKELFIRQNKMQLFWIVLIASSVKGASSNTVVTYTNKTIEVMPCLIDENTGSATWRDVSTGNVLYSFVITSPGIQDRDLQPKHENFRYSYVEDTQFNLIIDKLERNDEGTYACDVLGQTSVETVYHITVEVLAKPTVQYESQDVDALDVIVGTSYNLTCSAAGARSVSDLSLVWDPSLVVETPLSITPSSDDYKDYSITSTYNAVRGISSITCQLTGYVMQDEINDLRMDNISHAVNLNVRYAPICNMTLKEGEDCRNVTLTCKCEAVPADITQYSFFDPSLIYNGASNEFTTSAAYGTISSFSCSATNSIGPGDQTDPMAYNCDEGTTALPTTTITTVPLSTNEPTSTKATESTTEKSESTTTKKPGPRPLTPGAITGIIVGVLAVVIVIVVIAVIMYKTGKCGSNSSSSSVTDVKVTATNSHTTNSEPAPAPVYGEIKKDRKKKSSNSGKGIENDGMDPPTDYAEVKMKSDKLDDNGAGPRGDPEIPAYGVVDKNRTKDPTPAPRSSMRDSKNPSNPKQDGPMEMQYADLDHGNKPPSDEVRKPKEEPTEYATVQSVIV